MLWLPETGYLVDPTAQQFPEIAEHGGGPIIASGGTSSAHGDTVRARLRHGSLRVGYSLAPFEVVRR